MVNMRHRQARGQALLHHLPLVARLLERMDLTCLRRRCGPALPGGGLRPAKSCPSPSM